MTHFTASTPFWRLITALVGGAALTLMLTLALPKPNAQADSWDWRSLGEQAYNTNCMSCHQANGQGIPGAFPPLAGHVQDLYNAAGGRNFLIHVMLYGLQGMIEVNGQIYNGVMPAWGHLNDEQIAATINYTLTAWDDEANLQNWQSITPEEVAAERNLGLSPLNVLEQRQALGTAEAAPAPQEAAPVTAETAEEVEAVDETEPVEEAAVEAEPLTAEPLTTEPLTEAPTAATYQLALSADDLAGANVIVIRVVDADGQVSTTTIRLRDGIQSVEFEASRGE